MNRRCPHYAFSPTRSRGVGWVIQLYTTAPEMEAHRPALSLKVWTTTISVCFRSLDPTSAVVLVCLQDCYGIFKNKVTPYISQCTHCTVLLPAPSIPSHLLGPTGLCSRPQFILSEGLQFVTEKHPLEATLEVNIANTCPIKDIGCYKKWLYEYGFVTY